MADPVGCGRSPLPTTLYLTSRDVGPGTPCAHKNVVMAWSGTSANWSHTSVQVGSCFFNFTVTCPNASNQFKLWIYDTSYSLLDSITSTATQCNPLVVNFVPTGTEFSGCGCNSFGGFALTENQL